MHRINAVRHAGPLLAKHEQAVLLIFIRHIRWAAHLFVIYT